MLELQHKKLDVWKLSKTLIKEIYKLTATYPKEKLFGLTNQMRRASVSITSNIAEGASRKSKTERKRFFEISRSSLVELDTQLEISLDLNYLENISELIDSLIIELFGKMSRLIDKT